MQDIDNSGSPQEIIAPLPIKSLKEDWGGDGRGRMNLSGRCTAISPEYIPRKYMFLDTNTIAEQEWRINGIPGAAIGKHKLLTWQADCGASTSRVILPANAHIPSGIFTADLELFVLNGEIQIGEWKLTKHCYSFIPAGMKFGDWQVLSSGGVEILWMENSSLAYQHLSDNHPDTRLDEYIPVLDSKLLPWGKADTVQFVQASKKWLRKDANGGGIWLLTVLPHYDGLYAQVQSYNEEAYCLAGYCDIGDYHITKDYLTYVPSFTIAPWHRTDDGGLFLVRVDRDLSKISTVLSYAQ